MNILIAFLMVLGLVLAGSDGDWFPVANFAGLGCFWLGVMLIPRKWEAQ